MAKEAPPIAMRKIPIELAKVESALKSFYSAWDSHLRNPEIIGSVSAKSVSMQTIEATLQSINIKIGKIFEAYKQAFTYRQAGSIAAASAQLNEAYIILGQVEKQTRDLRLFLSEKGLHGMSKTIENLVSDILNKLKPLQTLIELICRV